MSERKREMTKACATCSQTFVRRRSGSGRLEDFGQFSRKKFCSEACRRGKKRVTKQAYSLQARKYLAPACECCGVTRELCIHHCNEDKSDNRSANLQTLCASCHNSWHGIQNRRGIAPAGRLQIGSGSRKSRLTAAKPAGKVTKRQLSRTKKETK